MTLSNTRRNEIRTGLFGIILYFGGFLAGELGLRVLNEFRFGDTGLTGDIAVEPTPDGAAANHGFFKDPAGLRRPYPSQQLGGVRINNFGFRGADIAEKKKGDVLRIAFLGSSTTYDADVAEGQTWPDQVIRSLHERLGACRFEMLNAGLPGFSTRNMETYWRTVVKDFSPDIVIALPGDMTPNVQVAAELAGFSLRQNLPESWLSRNSVLWSLITKNADVVRLQKSAFSENGKFQPDAGALVAAFSDNLGSLIEAVLSEEGVFLAVPTIASHVRRDMSPEEQVLAADSALYYMPFISIPTLLDLQERYNAEIRASVRNSDVLLLVDGDEDIPADSRHFVDSRHFSANGSAVMGKRVADALLSSNDFQRFIRAKTSCASDSGAH